MIQNGLEMQKMNITNTMNDNSVTDMNNDLPGMQNTRPNNN